MKCTDVANGVSAVVSVVGVRSNVAKVVRLYIDCKLYITLLTVFKCMDDIVNRLKSSSIDVLRRSTLTRMSLNGVYAVFVSNYEVFFAPLREIA